MPEPPATNEKTGIAFGTYQQQEDLVTTIEGLLVGELTVQDLCIVGYESTMADALNVLQDQAVPNALWTPLLSQTERFVPSDRDYTIVGSSGSFLNVLQRLMARQATLTSTVQANEYRIDGFDINTYLDQGRLILFVSVTRIELLAHTLKTLLRQSSDSVQSHEYRGLMEP